ncbi:TPA: hypothetical protein L3890_004857 [Pseudomonas aeruginosa]|nr:hypothetical protein [Pseudomonas aeruginosa]
MNPHLLTLALTTPLEQLLELPNAVRIAASAREDLQRFSTGQLQQMLVCMDAAITDTVASAQIKYGSGLVSREEQRDLDWFIEASNQPGWARLKSAPSATDRDYFRLLALYKLGQVIHATADTPPVALVSPVVATLMEALESLMLSDLLPDSPSTAQIIEDAWKAGLTPEADAADEVRKAQSQAGRQAADARHASNRAAKQKALELFASNTYRTKEEAYRLIGAQVCKAPGTIKNWIAGLQKDAPKQ